MELSMLAEQHSAIAPLHQHKPYLKILKQYKVFVQYGILTLVLFLAVRSLFNPTGTPINTEVEDRPTKRQSLSTEQQLLLLYRLAGLQQEGQITEEEAKEEEEENQHWRKQEQQRPYNTTVQPNSLVRHFVYGGRDGKATAQNLP